MRQMDPEIPPVKTLWDHIRTGRAQVRAARPLSFYLLFCIVVVVLLGTQVAYIQNDPKAYAFFLSLNVVFFFLVIFLAVLDVFEIARSHFRERERLFRATLGEKEFVDSLREGMARRRGRL